MDPAATSGYRPGVIRPARPADADYRRYRQAVAGQRLPLALVDLDAVDRNAARLVDSARRAEKTLRLATKSVRCPGLIEYLLALDSEVMRGLMSYSVREAEYLVGRGHRDILVAYPSVQDPDLDRLVELDRGGAEVAIVVDCDEHLDRLDRGACARGGEIPVVVEIDLSLRLTARLHLGVRRSPTRTAAEVVRLAERIRGSSGLRFAGVMGYEAQVAGIGEANPFSPALNPVRALIKRASMPAIRRRRREVAQALAAVAIDLPRFNGGGTGSLERTGAELAITEVTAGSGFLCSHLFDYYPDLDLEPAVFFALQVVRRPDPGIVTCHGGGLVASGEAGADRLPLPALPTGLRLLGLEGAGEVQTPVAGAAADDLELGDPVFFRHAKAGELAEHFAEYLLVRGDQVVGREPTYRGLGLSLM